MLQAVASVTFYLKLFLQMTGLLLLQKVVLRDTFQCSQPCYSQLVLYMHTLRVQSVLRAWLPMPAAVLGMVLSHIPCPSVAAPRRYDA